MTLHYAIISGVCAASAGAFGKLSGLEIFEVSPPFKLKYKLNNFIVCIVCSLRYIYFRVYL